MPNRHDMTSAGGATALGLCAKGSFKLPKAHSESREDRLQALLQTQGETIAALEAKIVELDRLAFKLIEKNVALDRENEGLRAALALAKGKADRLKREAVERSREPTLAEAARQYLEKGQPDRETPRRLQDGMRGSSAEAARKMADDMFEPNPSVSTYRQMSGRIRRHRVDLHGEVNCCIDCGASLKEANNGKECPGPVFAFIADSVNTAPAPATHTHSHVRTNEREHGVVVVASGLSC